MSLPVGDFGEAGPRVAVLMPTYEQASFLPRALRSLFDQTVTDWELALVDDGSHDGTAMAAAPFLADPRVRHARFSENRGLGAALNTGLAMTRAPVVAYLPSDDLWAPDHLAHVLAAFADPEVALVHSAVHHHERYRTDGAPDGHPLQLVQVAHRRIAEPWPERAELESDDPERLYWRRYASTAESAPPEGPPARGPIIPANGTRRSGRASTGG
ncbi:glycosyltransferase family 2 protein [Streptomyces sp. TRM70350]|uniref:glycosyltransferase family 2 protein n=1 Tax=Streptomyces sp. TRM70350 TaxID=2856165 RepID=UPI001C438D6B|nr:glycosyltransferase family 2 protein [Streptomyces sp. TRM70350]MBV7694120.1 glycosyltransferase [Streptomyces sp. TRM70350]